MPTVGFATGIGFTSLAAAFGFGVVLLAVAFTLTFEGSSVILISSSV